MNPPRKNRRLCETLKLLNGCKTGQEVSMPVSILERDKKSKKPNQNTFSMIKFYQSIPNYDEVRHLPECDFSERVQFLKKVHCDLSGSLLRSNCKRPVSSTSRCSKRKTSAKKKKGSATRKSALSPSLCNSFSRTCLVELDDLGSGCKQSPVGRISSANSQAISTPPPIKRLQALRERILAGIDDWRCQQKCPTPKTLSPVCSPNYHMHKVNDAPPPHYHPDQMHLHGLNSHSHLCDAFHNTCPLESAHEQKSQRCSTNYLRSPPKSTNPPTDHKTEFQNCDKRSPKCDEKMLMVGKKVYRARSCPRDLFSVSSKCSDNDIEKEHVYEHQHHHHNPNHHDHHHMHQHSNQFQNQQETENNNDQENESGKSRNGSAGSNWLRPHCRKEFTPCYMDDFASPSTSRQQKSRQRNSRTKVIPKIKVHKPKSKTPNSMDEYLSSKLVRNNLAASLRQKNARKKICEMEDEKLKATLDVQNFIPKCHQWNVRDSPGWKNFTTEDTTTEKLMREEARREEHRVRKHTHTMAMNIMRSRVKSAQLLLEGRALSAR